MSYLRRQVSRHNISIMVNSGNVVFQNVNLSPKMNLGRKIVIVGSSGSGKTTLARRLSEQINIKHHEIDELFWKPGWVQTAEAEFRESVSKVTGTDKWIIDGNYMRVQDLTIGRADTIIWLDPNLPKIMFRVTLRTAGRLMKQKPLWHGNRESLKMALSKDSIILYSLNNYLRKKRWYNSLMGNEKLKHLNWIIISNGREEREFWRDLRKELRKDMNINSPGGNSATG